MISQGFSLKPFCSGSRAGKTATRHRVPCARAVSEANATELFSALDFSVREVRAAPSTLKQEASGEVMKAMQDLQNAGLVPKWGSAMNGTMVRRNVFLGELRQVGIKQPDGIAKPSVRNDAAFLWTVVGVFSVLSICASFLPGDIGFFTSYLVGGVPLVVLAIGSTNPSALSFLIDKFSQVFPDYRDRVLRHEAAHFLIGYLLGVPVVDYSLSLGREHTDFAEAKIQRRLFQSTLSDAEVDQLAVMSMAGVAAEGQAFEEIMGQTADLFDLQRILNKSENKLSDASQQNITRWAVWQACVLLRSNKAEYEALMDAMGNGKSVEECVKAIEAAA